MFRETDDDLTHPPFDDLTEAWIRRCWEAWHEMQGRRSCNAWPYQYKPGRFPGTYLAGYPWIYQKCRDDDEFWGDDDECPPPVPPPRVWAKPTQATWVSLRRMIAGTRGRLSDVEVDAMLVESMWAELDEMLARV